MNSGDRFGSQGGDLRSLGPGDWLDLSTCVNGYGPAPAAEQALRQADPSRLLKHPYDSEDLLREAYAAHLAVSGNDLVVGRGTTEFIWSLSRNVEHSTVAVPLPAYTDFLRAFPTREARCANGSVTAQDVERLMASSQLVLISNPSNPTGSLIAPRDLVACCDGNPTATLVVDESYVEFLPKPGEGTLVGADVENLIVLRSPSKFYGIAGVRTGVAWVPGRTHRAVLDGGRGPWPVSSLDADIAVAALADDDWAATIRRRLLEDATRLEKVLGALRGRVTPSDVHYRLWHVDDIAIADHLRRNAVAVRVLGEAHGFDEPVVRITAPTADVFDRVATALLAAAAV